MREPDPVAPGPSAPRPERLVVAEDEPAIAQLVRTYLQAAGFEVLVVGDGERALQEVTARRPAALLLDIGLPRLDGMEVLTRLRRAGDLTPVLFLTARDDEVDRVLGLELGADDYVTKPFSPRELVARVRAVLRRGAAAPRAVLAAGRVTIDLAARRASVDGRDLGLTTTELDLLARLLRDPTRVWTRDELLADVWGHPAGTPTRTLDVHIAQLRAKLGDALELRTVRGVGYGVQAGP